MVGYPSLKYFGFHGGESSLPSLVFKSSSLIPETIMCATNVVDKSVVLGTNNGKVYEFNTETNKATLLHDFHPKERLPNSDSDIPIVSVNPDGDTALFNSYISETVYLINLRTKESKTIPKTDRLNVYASCVYRDDIIAYASSQMFDISDPDWSYAQTLEISTGQTQQIGQFKIDASNNDLYCEVIKKYTGPDTMYFKSNEMYGQFRSWAKDKGYIHGITSDTSKETAYDDLLKNVVPLIFDFVPKKARMVCVYNDGSVCLICLQTNRVLTVWEKIKLSDTMPGVCASQYHAFVNSEDDGYLLNLFSRGESVRLPSLITGTTCAKALDGSQLVLFSAASQVDLVDLMFQEAGIVGDTRSVYGQTWIWTEVDDVWGGMWRLKSYLQTKMINLSGPVSSKYFSNDSKKVVILGDRHGDFTRACVGNSVRVDNYLEEAFANESMEFNLILEDPSEWFQLEYALQNNLPFNDKETEFMSTIYNIATKHYGKSEKKVVHVNKARATLQVDKLEFGRQWQLILKQLKPDTDLSDLFMELYKPFIELFLEFHQEFVEGRSASEMNYGSALLNKSIQELETKVGKERLQKLTDIVHEKLDSFLSKLFSDPIHAKDIIPMSIQILSIITHFAELNTVKTVMVSPLNNNIVYVGDAHARILKKYFDVLGFSLDWYGKKNFRCVLALPFEVYFNSTK